MHRTRSIEPRQRAWRHVPLPVLIATLLLLLAAHWARPDASGRMAVPTAEASVPAWAMPTPPSIDVLRIASLGDTPALSRFLSLWIQAAETGLHGGVPLRNLDYGALLAWLDRCLLLDPSRDDLVAMAARVYAEVNEPSRQRLAIAFVEKQFAQAPTRRWPYLAHVTVLARHRLNDLALARTLARTLRESTRPGEAPAWAREMELTVLQAQGESQAARELAGALLVEGGPREGAELRFLERYLASLPKDGGAGAAQRR